MKKVVAYDKKSWLHSYFRRLPDDKHKAKRQKARSQTHTFMYSQLKE